MCSLKCSASSWTGGFRNNTSFPLFLALWTDRQDPVACDQMFYNVLVLETFGVTRGWLRLTGIKSGFFFRCCDGDRTPELPAVRVVQL